MQTRAGLAPAQSCGFAEILMAGIREGRAGPGQSWTGETAALGTRRCLLDTAQEPSPNLPFSSLCPVSTHLNTSAMGHLRVAAFSTKSTNIFGGRYKSWTPVVFPLYTQYAEAQAYPESPKAAGFGVSTQCSVLTGWAESPVYDGLVSPVWPCSLHIDKDLFSRNCIFLIKRPSLCSSPSPEIIPYSLGSGYWHRSAGQGWSDPRILKMGKLRHRVVSGLPPITQLLRTEMHPATP